MASNREWAEAYLEQAREDLKAAQIGRINAPSDFCMLMQMTFEKAAKAALLRKGTIRLEKAVSSHSGASKLVKILKTNREYLPLADMGKPYLWKDILPLLTELERSQPSLAGKGQPSLEYPWENSEGTVCWPARDFPMIARLKSSPQIAPRLLKFASLLISDISRGF